MIDSALGGVLIGLAAVGLMHSVGRIAGISGIVGNAMHRSPWAIVFIVGLGFGGALGFTVGGAELTNQASVDTRALVIGGLLVGLGTRLGSGCTSGHGVCGIARLSMRSIIATVVFMLIGIMTATWMYGS